MGLFLQNNRIDEVYCRKRNIKMKSVKSILKADIKGKRVLVRVDFNVPIKEKKISDNTRILAHGETINYILEKGAKKVILISHLGRPKGKIKPEFSLKIVCGELKKILARDITFFNDCVGDEVKNGISKLQDNSVCLLENLRFHPEEEKNDESFSKELAELADLFVQDAFAVSHRAHASTVGVTKFLPSVAGFLLMKEVKYLSELLLNPVRPFVAVLGGAKVSTKISVMSKLLKKADILLVGGAMSYTFLKALGQNIGSSLYEEDFIGNAKETADVCKNLFLPEDHVISKSPEKPDGERVVKSIPDGFFGVDIGPETVSKYSSIIKRAKTIFWNGPMGIFEVDDFSKGTQKIAEAIAEATTAGAISVAGGGDSVAAVKKAGVSGKFSHISTGGGASLEFVEGKTLPGIEALMEE